MLEQRCESSGRAFAALSYFPGQSNACPACHGHHWHVGRQTAECAGCGAALPLADPRNRGFRPARLGALRQAWAALAQATP